MKTTHELTEEAERESAIYARRKDQKAEWEFYRRAARRLHPGIKVDEFAAATEDANRTGAFLTVTVWVPRDEMLKEF